MGDFCPGITHTVFTIPGSKSLVKFATLICFEDLFPSLVRKFSRDGAQILITITNEAWFKNSAEPIQHLAMGVFRAIENRSWFIRCANTGISCFIDPQGKIKNKITKQGKDIFISGYQTLTF